MVTEFRLEVGRNMVLEEMKITPGQACSDGDVPAWMESREPGVWETSCSQEPMLGADKTGDY